MFYFLLMLLDSSVPNFLRIQIIGIISLPASFYLFLPDRLLSLASYLKLMCHTVFSLSFLTISRAYEFFSNLLMNSWILSSFMLLIRDSNYVLDVGLSSFTWLAY